MGCPPVRGDKQRALASGLYYLQVDKHGITILTHTANAKSDRKYFDIHCYAVLSKDNKPFAKIKVKLEQATIPY